MNYIRHMGVLVLALMSTAVWGQTVSGTVTDENNQPLPGATVVVQGTNRGTSTDFDGKYQINAAQGETLVFSYVGYATQSIAVSGATQNVSLQPDNALDEVVVTALGITREKKSLGYAVQEVEGNVVQNAKESSFISALSGRVSGLDIRKSNSLGGSVNAVIRGVSSLTRNNQALFVVDGVPISNARLNDSDVQNGRGGYDFGNAASDINPNDIANISVLKGASASALYGSNGQNGVILITTKKGTKKGKGLGISISSTLTTSYYDKSTFPEYQNKYGAGYGAYYGSTGYFEDVDVNGDGTVDKLIPVGEDASFGGKLDGTMVYDWSSLFPQLDTYLKPRPYLPAVNGPEYIFQTGVSNTTSVNFEGGTDKGTFRMGYTRDNREGILPNSEIKKDVIDLAGSFKFNEKLTANGKMSFYRTKGKGRYGTGYDDVNVVRGLRQWHQVNVDLKEQEDAYHKTKQNITWNPNSNTDLTPHYFDNPYFQLFENYATDQRNRVFAVASLDYEIADWMSATARFGMDNTADIQERRANIGSIVPSFYSKYQRFFEQFDYTFMLNLNKELSEDFKVSGVLGANIFTTKTNYTDSETTGGLVVAGVWSLSNSANALNPPTDYEANTRKVGYFAQATLSYKDFWYVDGSIRFDRSSTLPAHSNEYSYPSISTSFLFHELLDVDALSFGKLRFGHAKVANDAGSYQIATTASANPAFGSTPMYYIPDTSLNPDLRPESTTESEVGLETQFINNRVGLEVSYYKRNTVDQIIPVQVSTASGFNFRYVNAGDMENKGIEVSINANPVKTANGFNWKTSINWAKNENEVISLFEDGENILLNSQWSSAVNARKGQPFGTITGTDFIYDKATGKKVVDANGRYLTTSSTTEILGNIQPDWKAGIFNSLNYKDFSLGFLIDIQKGGELVSWDNAFGLATGLYKETAGLNDKGNPVRDPVNQGGGIKLPGTVKQDGTPNTIYADASTYRTPIGYYGSRNIAQFVYDASYVKLREVSLSYNFPKSLTDKLLIQNMSLSLVGRNLWIIDKKVPYTDPEASQSAGNYGNAIQIGALPATKDISFNLSINF